MNLEMLLILTQCGTTIKLVKIVCDPEDIVACPGPGFSN